MSDFESCIHTPQEIKPENVKRVWLDFYKPATPPLRLIEAIGNWLHAWQRRRKLISLLKYDDHVLDDMGYSRAELLMAARLPIKVDGYHVLKMWQEKRRITG